MNSILKGAAACITCFVGGMVTFVWLVLEVIFRAIRMVRYGFLKCIMTVARNMNLDEYNARTCNKVLRWIMDEDIDNAIRIEELKLTKN